MRVRWTTDAADDLERALVRTITLNDIRQRFKVPAKRFALTLKRGDNLIELATTTRRPI